MKWLLVFLKLVNRKLIIFEGLNKLYFFLLDILNENRICFGVFESDMFGVKMEEIYFELIEESFI